MDDLVQFLRARLAEDERMARVLIDDHRPGHTERWEFCEDGAIRDSGRRASLRVKFTWAPEATHIIRHDPARVLAEVEAKREIVNLMDGLLAAGKGDSEVDHYGGLSAAEETLLRLARLFRDHPDFNPAWLED